MARGKRGGNQPPARPAAVSGPGALSQRTDGAVPRPPVTGLPYGQNAALTAQQGAAPMSAPGPAASAGGGPAGPAGPRTASQRFGARGVFSPTNNPDEPLTAGVDWGDGPGAPPQPLAEDPYLVAKALYAIAPSPELERLIARLSRA